MEEPSTRSFGRLRTWFLVILMATVTFIFLLQFTTNGFLLSSFNRYRLTLVSKKNKIISPKPIRPPSLSNTRMNGTVYNDSLKSSVAMTSLQMEKKNGSRFESGLKNVTAVVLLTYMRSGSSLTGDILQQPNDAFYLFEPLMIVYNRWKRKQSISFLNGTVMFPSTYDLRTVHFGTLLGWLSCNFSTVPVESLLKLDFLSYGKALRPYTKCMKERVGLKDPFKFSGIIFNNSFTYEKDFLKCITDLRDVCLRSKYRIVKTIRTDMKMAEGILDKIEGSKVVHLVRDPRATIESKSHRDVCQLGLNVCIQEHCQIVREDMLYQEKLNSRSARRFYTVLYEDIATRPVETAKAMYSFIGIEFTPTITEYVYNITLGKNKSGCAVCNENWQLGNSVRSSKKHVDAWKQKLSAKYINITQILCSDVIKHYGFEYYKVPPVPTAKTTGRLLKNAIKNITKLGKQYLSLTL